MLTSKIIYQLKKLQKKAYAPYSKFRVAAILETKCEHLIKGVNVENASFPMGSCAEKNAINSAIALGFNKNDFKALYIIGDHHKIISPCGGCRQVLAEFFNDNTKIYLFNKNADTYEEFSIKSLLPNNFTF